METTEIVNENAQKPECQCGCNQIDENNITPIEYETRVNTRNGAIAWATDCGRMFLSLVGGLSIIAGVTNPYGYAFQIGVVAIAIVILLQAQQLAFKVLHPRDVYQVRIVGKDGKEVVVD